MSLQTFTAKWLGRRTDIDGVYGYQCVDLIKRYFVDEYSMPLKAYGNAIDYWTRTDSEILKRFDRIATDSPQVGDLVVINSRPGNKYGHLVIALSNRQGTTFEALEQNGATGDGDGLNGDEVRKRQIQVNRIAGVLRPKSQIKPSNPKHYTIKKGDTFWALEDAWSMAHGTLQRLNSNLDPRKLQIGSKIRIG